MDSFEIETGRGSGTTRDDRETARAGRAGAAELGELARSSRRWRARSVAGPLGELQLQNQELMQALAELQRSPETSSRDLNRELEETNRGVVALYAELDERAEELRAHERDEVAVPVQHEPRARARPLNSMLALSRAAARARRRAADRRAGAPGPLHPSAATSLLALVNDLLDLARVEAGKTVVRRRPFEGRGPVRPRCAACSVRCTDDDAVALVFEPADELPAAPYRRGQARADPAQPHLQRAQVHRRGRGPSLRRSTASAARSTFVVADTGIGISHRGQAAHLRRVRPDREPAAGRRRGTGLGLAVSQRLAAVLGGRHRASRASRRRVDVHARDPARTARAARCRRPSRGRSAPRCPSEGRGERSRLVIDDDEVARYLAETHCVSLGYG